MPMRRRALTEDYSREGVEIVVRKPYLDMERRGPLWSGSGKAEDVWMGGFGGNVTIKNGGHIEFWDDDAGTGDPGDGWPRETFSLGPRNVDVGDRVLGKGTAFPKCPRSFTVPVTIDPGAGRGRTVEATFIPSGSFRQAWQYLMDNHPHGGTKTKFAGDERQLRKQLIRLAHRRPELRPDLLPLLAQASGRVAATRKRKTTKKRRTTKEKEAPAKAEAPNPCEEIKRINKGLRGIKYNPSGERTQALKAWEKAQKKPESAEAVVKTFLSIARGAETAITKLHALALTIHNPDSASDLAQNIPWAVDILGIDQSNMKKALDAYAQSGTERGRMWELEKVADSVLSMTDTYRTLRGNISRFVKDDLDYQCRHL